MHLSAKRMAQGWQVLLDWFCDVTGHRTPDCRSDDGSVALVSACNSICIQPRSSREPTGRNGVEFSLATSAFVSVGGRRGRDVLCQDFQPVYLNCSGMMQMLRLYHVAPFQSSNWIVAGTTLPVAALLSVMLHHGHLQRTQSLYAGALSPCYSQQQQERVW